MNSVSKFSMYFTNVLANLTCVGDCVTLTFNGRDVVITKGGVDLNKSVADKIIEELRLH